MGRRSEEPREAGPVTPTPGVGVPVEVRSRFEGTWCPGFEIAEVLTDFDRALGFRVRRMSDGATLPEVFAAEDVARHIGDDR